MKLHSAIDDSRLHLLRRALERRDEVQHAGADATVAAMADSLALYAQQMQVPRGIVDAMMAIPADRLRFLTRSDLAAHGILPVDPVARVE